MSEKFIKDFYKAFDIPTRKFITDGIYPEIIDAPPPITDRILLELIDIVLDNFEVDFWFTKEHTRVCDSTPKNSTFTYRTGGNIKTIVLQILTIQWDKTVNKKAIYHAVRKIMGVE